MFADLEDTPSAAIKA